jgi:hypothetical protein
MLTRILRKSEYFGKAIKKKKPVNCSFTGFCCFLLLLSAERKRFELSMQLPTYYLSRVAPSTTRTPLCVVNKGANIVKRIFNPNPGPNQILISPRKGLPSMSMQVCEGWLQAKTYIILVMAASAVMSEPLMTPICCKNLLV